MKCPEPEKLLAYMEGGPSQVSRAEARHIRRCKTCAAQIAELREVGDVLRPRATPTQFAMDAEMPEEAPQRLPAFSRRAMRRKETVAFDRSVPDVMAGPPTDAEPAASDQAEVIERARQRFLRHLDAEGLALRLRGTVSDLLHRLSDLMAAHPGLAPGHLGEVVAEQVAFDVLPRPPFEGQFTHSRLAFDAHPADDLTTALSSLTQAIEAAVSYYRRNNYWYLRRPETAESDLKEMTDIVHRTVDLLEASRGVAPDDAARSEARTRMTRLWRDLERLRSAHEPEQP